MIVTTRNRANLLRKALQSVLQQSFDDFELIVVDDHSEDETRQVAESFTDPRVRYLRHDRPRGEGGSRNSGVESSRGELVAFLDDDDEWLEDKLQLQVDCLDSATSPVAASYTSLVEIDDEQSGFLRVRPAFLEGDLLQPLLRQGNFIVPSTVLVRRQCFLELGCFDENLPGSLDYDMWIRIAERYRFAAIQRPLVRYRVHRHRMSRNFALHIQGVTALIRKYPHYFATRTAWNSNRYFYLGTWLALENDLPAARRAFRQSVAARPLHGRPWVAWSFTLLGSRAFRHLLGCVTRSSTDSSSYGQLSGGTH